MTTDEKWRSRIAKRCGGANFDAPGGGYSFSAVLAEERELEKLNKAGDPTSVLLCLSVADPTWRMEEDAMNAGRLYYESTPYSTRYTDNYGIKFYDVGTQDHLVAHLNRRFASGGVVFTEGHVQYSPHSIKGSLSEFLPSLLFEEGVGVIFPAPGYGVIKDPINGRGNAVIETPLQYKAETGKWLIDFSSIERTLAISTKYVLYLNVPHNPTGTGYTKEYWSQVFAWANSNDVTLIIDEAYIDLCFDEKCVSALSVPGWEDCAIVLQSVSKGWKATGLRFGWLVGHPTIIKAIRKVIDVKDSGLFGPSIASGLACLSDYDVAIETKVRYKKLHKLLYEGLISAGFQTLMPDAGLCQFTPAPREANSVKFKDSLECAKWFRETLRISLMHYTVNQMPWLRWAVTIKPVTECRLFTEEVVLEEAVRRLQSTTFAF